MPIFFVGYALFVWWVTIRWRRSLRGTLALAAGIGGLLALNLFHIKLGDWTDGTVELPLLRSLMYPYTAFVALVGGYILILPHRAPAACQRCHYDLTGLLTERGAQCPECGELNGPMARRAYRPSGLQRPSLHTSDNPPPAALPAALPEALPAAPLPPSPSPPQPEHERHHQRHAG